MNDNMVQSKRRDSIPGSAVAGATVHAIVEATRTLLVSQNYEALSQRDVAANAQGGITGPGRQVLEVRRRGPS